MSKRNITTPRFGRHLLLALPLLLVTLTSCHKTCTCIQYNGGSHTYTADEVDDYGVTCSNMVYQAGTQYYSVCNWD